MNATRLHAADEAARQQVLDAIQSGFPLESDPYGVLGRRLGLPRAEVLDAVAALRADGSIRRLGASFNSKKLGYASTLCALAVPGGPEEIDRVAAIVNAYPNVTHNYRRNNRYNLWFTVIARGASEVERILHEVGERTGHTDILNLPATAVYKIRVDFSAQAKSATVREAPAGESRSHLHPGESGAPAVIPFDANDPLDVALVRWAQEDIAGGGRAPDPEPFATAAAEIARQQGDASIDEAWVLARLRALKQAGAIRRFGALVAHRRIGYAFNGMTVWDVAPARLDQVGAAFSAQPFVSHCYARPRNASWPYNLYAMVHAKTRGELDAHVAALQAMAGQKAQVLVSDREYKKSSMRYFAETHRANSGAGGHNGE